MSTAFKFKDPNEDPFALKTAEKDSAIDPLAFKIPDIHEIMRDAGVQDIEQDEDGKEKSRNKRKTTKVTVICCCGARGCNIGPMSGREEETEEQDD